MRGLIRYAYKIVCLGVIFSLMHVSIFSGNNKKMICRDGDIVEGLMIVDDLFLEDNASVTLNIPLPIQGQVEFGVDSTLHLMGDLHTSSHVSFSIGQECMDHASINGHGYTMFLGSDVTIPASRSIHIVGDLTIDGCGYSVNFADEFSELYVQDGSTLTLRNLTLRGWMGNCQITGCGIIILQDCVIDLAPETFAEYIDEGDIEVRGLVSVQGGGTLAFGGKSSLKIASFSTLLVDMDTTFDWTNPARNNFIMTDATSRLFLNGGIIHADTFGNNKGLHLTRGSLLFANKCLVENNGNQLIEKSLELGDGIDQKNDVEVKVLSGACIEIDGFMNYNPAQE